MKNEPLVSIIVLNYNAGKLLSECVESIFDSNYNNLEVIVVDNVSKDDSHKKCKEKFTKNTILKQEEIKKSDGKTYTVIKLDTVQKDTMIAFDKAHILSIKDFSGWVNIKSDASDKSKLNINPLLGIKQKNFNNAIAIRFFFIDLPYSCFGSFFHTLFLRNKFLTSVVF